jgi:hypothetical protein
MPNPFDYMQFISTDQGRAKEFYSSLFDWRTEDTPIGNDMVQTVIRQPDGPWGGIMPSTNPNAPSMWHVYVQVVNMDETLLKTVQLGGQIIVPKTPVAGSGYIAFIQDPTGAMLGVTQRDEIAIHTANQLLGASDAAARPPPGSD